MAFNLSAFAGAGAQFFDSNGTPLAGGLLYVYTAGTTTPATTWTTSAGTVANTNPIVMNAAGRTPFEIWLNSGVTYKFALYTSTNVLIGTYDNIPAIDDPTVFNNLITVTGTNTLTGVSVPPYTSYVAGMTLSFVPANTNTDAVTLDLDGLGAKNVFVGSSTALSSGDLVAGRIAQIQYDGTRFQLYQSSLADNSVTTAKIVDLNVTTAKLADNAVTTAKITDLNVTTGKLADSAVTTDKINNLDVTTAKIANANITAGKLDGAQSGFAPIYGARAWVNFDGTGTVAIRASGNVSSITDNGTGDYTVNFATGMSDDKYSVVGLCQRPDTNNDITLTIPYASLGGAYSTTAVRLVTTSMTASWPGIDASIVSVTIHR
jgi:hypothetical protein